MNKLNEKGLAGFRAMIKEKRFNSFREMMEDLTDNESHRKRELEKRRMQSLSEILWIVMSLDYKGEPK